MTLVPGDLQHLVTATESVEDGTVKREYVRSLIAAQGTGLRTDPGQQLQILVDHQKDVLHVNGTENGRNVGILLDHILTLFPKVTLTSIL